MNQLRNYRQLIVFSFVSMFLLSATVAASASVTVPYPTLAMNQPFSLTDPAVTLHSVQSSSLFGLVWTDLNQNGVHDEQEPLASGETIFITPDAESDFAQLLVLSTDQQGQFHAGNLAFGRYRVWANSQSAADALVITVTEDRTVMTVQLPLNAFMLYMPDIRM